MEPRPSFEEQSAAVSPHDEEGGRFDGASVSPGFGILYLHGYTTEAAGHLVCGGYFGEEPEHVLELGYAMQVKLVLHTDDEGLVMGVKGPDGALSCWDEDSRSNANVSLTRDFSPGRHEVWVGSARRDSSSAYRLVLSE